MKMIRVCLLAAALCGAGAAGALAQVPRLEGEDDAGKVNLYVDAGLGMPQGDFGDFWKTGFGGGVGVGLAVSPGFELVGRVHYNSFGLNDDGKLGVAYLALAVLEIVDPDGNWDATDVPYMTVDGLSTRALEITVEGKYTFPGESSFKPFVLGGLGVVNVSWSDLEWSYNRPGFDPASLTWEEFFEGETKFAFDIGLGAEVEMSPKADFFFEAKYVSIQTEGEATNYLPFRAGVKFGL